MKSFVKGWPPGWYCRTSTSWLEFLGSDCCNLLKIFFHPRMRYSPTDKAPAHLGCQDFTSSPSSLASSLSDEHKALNVKKREKKKNLESLLFKKPWNILYGWLTVLGGNYNGTWTISTYFEVWGSCLAGVTIMPLLGGGASVSSWSGIKSVPPALGVQSFNHWTSGKSPARYHFYMDISKSLKLWRKCHEHKILHMFNVKSQPKALLPYL